MEKFEVGRFQAISFDNQSIYEFIVFNDYTMACPYLGLSDIRRLYIKPRFIIDGPNYSYELNVFGAQRDKDPNHLIGNYAISEELFAILKTNGMIRYSTDMAFLYNFSDKNGYDKRGYHVGSPYKWASKKGPILERQRQGKFN